MTDQLCTVEDCDRTVPDTCYVCPGCGERLLGLLRLMPDVVGQRTVVPCDRTRPELGFRETGDAPVTPGLASDLDVAVARQARFGTGGGRTSADTPLPVDLIASEARWVLLETMTVHADEIARLRGLFRPLNTLTALAAWLTDQIQWLRQRPDGADTISALTAALTNACHVVDRPAERRYAGPCSGTEDGDVPCTAELYALPGRDTITCRNCEATYDVDERRDWLLDQAEDVLLPATELARAVGGFGVRITGSTIRSWARRGRILARGSDRRGNPQYRVGDAITLAASC